MTKRINSYLLLQAQLCFTPPPIASNVQFTDQLLASGDAVLTQDPWRAHLLFIPALLHAHVSNIGDPDPHLARVVDHVRAEHAALWARRGGRDHFLWTPGDRASCYVRSPQALAPIKLTHFGYFEHNGRNDEFTGVTVNAPVYPVGVNPAWGCYHPLKDIVLPPFVPGAGRVAQQTYLHRASEGGGGDATADPNDDDIGFSDVPEHANVGNAAPRDTLLFFAGRLQGADEPGARLPYSGGTRQEVAKWMPEWAATSPDVVILAHWAPGMAVGPHSSKFCLAPYGHGFSTRVVAAVVAGCVPVVIQEQVFQPFEELLPYEQFSLRLTNAEVRRLPEILRSVTPEQLAALQRGLARHWPAFVWPRRHSGRAFEHALRALRRRHLHDKARYYALREPHLF